ncbi:unnamed protein product [Lampetra fluviatilis]
METRQTARARVPEEDTAEVIEPETAHQDMAQPGADAFLPGHRHEEGPQPDALRLAHERLAELLYAAAATLENITRLGAGGPPRGEGSRRPERLPAISEDSNFEFPAIVMAAAEGVAGLNLGSDTALAGTAASSPAEGASSHRRQAIPSAIRADAQPSPGDNSLQTSKANAALQQRLPPLKEFVGAEGDWGGFQRRFIAHQEIARWSDDEALCALPALLDADALAALTSAPKEKRSTLPKALQLLAGVYGPSAECREQFYERKRGEKESPLAYRTSLLALAKTAFPRMDDDGVDAMVTEKILLLADDLDIAVVAQEDAEMTSLQAARLLHANLLSLRRKASRASAGRAVAAATLPTEELFAVDHRRQQAQEVRSAWDGSSRFNRPSSPPGLPRCFNCGVRGHVASGCRSPRQRGTTPRRDAGPPLPKLQQHDPASRGTTHIRAQISIGDIKLSGPIFVSSSLAVPCLLGTDFFDQGCIELPSGRRMAFLPSPAAAPTAFATTVVRGDGDPFIAVLNVGSQTVVVPQGTVLAHATPMPCELQIPAPLGKIKLDEHVKFNLDKLTEARDAARLNSDRRQKANERLRRARAHVLQWKPGDRAWLHCPQVHRE